MPIYELTDGQLKTISRVDFASECASPNGRARSERQARCDEIQTHP